MDADGLLLSRAEVEEILLAAGAVNEAAIGYLDPELMNRLARALMPLVEFELEGGSDDRTE